MSKSRKVDLKTALRDIEVAISETDQVHPRGGHRHGQHANIARAGWHNGTWVAYAKRKGRWLVVGKGQSYQHAIRIARAKAGRG